MKDIFFITSKKKAIDFIPSHSCITQTIQSKNPLTSEELLARAYKNKILDIKQDYFFYSFFQSLTQEYRCFFFPKSSQNPATLDILLPFGLKPQLFCVFLSKHKNYCCFYQDQALVFCKEFQSDLGICIQQIKLFFDCNISEIFCLCYPDAQHSLAELKKKHPLKPLLSLFTSNRSFQLSTPAIMLEDFYNLNPKNTNIPYKNLKILSAFLSGFLILFSASALAINLYHSYLLKNFESLNQNISSSSFASPIEEIKHLESQNQAHLSALMHFSLLELQKLDALSHILSLIASDDLLSIRFIAPQTFSLLFKDQLNLSPLIASLNHLGYQCKFYKEQNGTSLEVSKI